MHLPASSSRSKSWMPCLDPNHSRSQRGRWSTKLFAVVSFSRSRLRRTSETGTFLSAEDADSP